jgi:hypothetical protein
VANYGYRTNVEFVGDRGESFDFLVIIRDGSGVF